MGVGDYRPRRRVRAPIARCLLVKARSRRAGAGVVRQEPKLQDFLHQQELGTGVERLLLRCSEPSFSGDF
jgi:hypothetical protein